MDKNALVLEFLRAKFSNNQEKIDGYVRQQFIDSLANNEEYKEFLALHKAKIEASRTPEAIEAERLEIDKQKQDAIKVIDEELAEPVETVTK